MTSSRPRPCIEAWNACAVPWKLVVIVAGSQVSRRRVSTPSTASPSGTPGLRLNEIVTDGSWPEWLTRQRADARFRAAPPRSAAPACRWWSWT